MYIVVLDQAYSFRPTLVRIWYKYDYGSLVAFVWYDVTIAPLFTLAWSDQIWYIYIYIYIPRILILGNIQSPSRYLNIYNWLRSQIITFSDLGDKRILIGITWHPVTVTICFWSFSLRASYQASLAASGGCRVPPIPFFTCRKLDPRLRKDLRRNWVLAGSSLLRDRHISTFKCTGSCGLARPPHI